MKLFRVILYFILSLLLCTVIIVLTWAVLERNRDPVTVLNHFNGKANLAQDSILAAGDTTREYRSLQLNTEFSGRIQAFLSLPGSGHAENFPVIIILGGLNIGVKNFEMIPEPGANALLIYDYPYSPQYWYDGTAITQIPVIRSAVLDVPSQVLALAEWAGRQEWSDNDGVSILGYSFGALFVPAVYHLASVNKVNLKPGVIAYGGADIYQLLKTNLRKVAEPFKSVFAWLASTAIWSIDPVFHAPQMRNEFLVINSFNDHQISDYSWQTLHDLIPEPKTVVLLNDGHMHPRKPELTLKLVAISKRWLLERGLINP